MDFTAELSMNDIEQQFDEFDELSGLDTLESDTEIMRGPKINELRMKNRRALDLLSDNEIHDDFEDDWDGI